jgi:hypothetical protein
MQCSRSSMTRRSLLWEVLLPAVSFAIDADISWKKKYHWKFIEVSGSAFQTKMNSGHMSPIKRLFDKKRPLKSILKQRNKEGQSSKRIERELRFRDLCRSSYPALIYFSQDSRWIGADHAYLNTDIDILIWLYVPKYFASNLQCILHYFSGFCESGGQLYSGLWFMNRGRFRFDWHSTVQAITLIYFSSICLWMLSWF